MLSKKIIFFGSLILASSLAAAPIKYAQMTPLQRHVSFFDRNHDGFISVSETTESLQILGDMCWFKARAMATAIHLGLSSTAGCGWRAPLTLDLALIHRGKHSSDTGIYDEDGNFVEEKFVAMALRYADMPQGAFSIRAIEQMIADNYQDFTGNKAAQAEFGLLMDFAGEECFINGESRRCISQASLRSFYYGDLFYNLANERIPD